MIDFTDLLAIVATEDAHEECEREEDGSIWKLYPAGWDDQFTGIKVYRIYLFTTEYFCYTDPAEYFCYANSTKHINNSDQAIYETQDAVYGGSYRRIFHRYYAAHAGRGKQTHGGYYLSLSRYKQDVNMDQFQYGSSHRE